MIEGGGWGSAALLSGRKRTSCTETNAFREFLPTLYVRMCARECWRGEVCAAAAAATAAFDGVFVSKDKCGPLNLQAGGWGRTSGDREEL